MAIYHGNVNNEYKTGIVSTKRTAIITNTSYGGIKHLMLMPFIQELKKQNRLLEYKEIGNLSFSGKIPTNKPRAKSIFELEELIVSKYKNYVLIRIDIKPINRSIKLFKEDYLDFIKTTRNNIRHNGLLKLLLCGWCYIVEDDSYDDDHLHWYIFINANRYLNLSNNKRNKLYKNDLDSLISSIYKYIDSRNSDINYCNINLADMSNYNSKKRLIIINENDYLLRNCARAWCTYICKKENKAIGKHYGKSIFENKNMENNLDIWLDSLRRLTTMDEDYLFLSSMIPGMKHHLSRIESLFKLEEEVARNCDNYLLIPIKLSVDSTIVSQSKIADFLKKYNIYKLNNDLLENHEIAYFWIINEIENSMDFYFNVFLQFNNKSISAGYDIFNTIKKWMLNIDGVDNSNIDDLIISTDDYVSVWDIRKRNALRLELIKMSITQNEDKDMSPRNYRLFSKSKVKVRNK